MSDSIKNTPDDQRSMLVSRSSSTEEITERIKTLSDCCEKLSVSILQSSANSTASPESNPVILFLSHCGKELRLLKLLIEQALQDRFLGELEASDICLLKELREVAAS